VGRGVGGIVDVVVETVEVVVVSAVLVQAAKGVIIRMIANITTYLNMLFIFSPYPGYNAYL
jgi:hypothetical protein